MCRLKYWKTFAYGSIKPLDVKPYLKYAKVTQYPQESKLLDLCLLNHDCTRSIQPTPIPQDSRLASRARNCAVGLSSLCQVTHTTSTRMMITRLILNEPPTNSFGALLRLLISGIHCLNTRMKAKNLILMNHQSQILNLMNHQSSGVPLAIVGADNQVQFFNVD